ncbi:MAG: yedA [Acidobacteria bacterium]|nr:yedA [Acidobacteriota bacterium]
MKENRALAMAAFAVVCIVWGTTYLAIRIGVETIPPVLLTATRYVVAGLVMTGVCLARGARLPRDRRTLGNLALVGFLMVGVGNLAVVWAEQWVPSGMAALLVATAPFWMAIVEMLRPEGDRVDLRRAIGMLVGFIGVALLVTPGGSGGTGGHFDSHFLIGAIVIQVGAIGWQLGSVRGKYHLKGVPLLLSAGLQMLFGGILTGIIGFAVGEGPRFVLTPRTFAALAYLTVFGSILAYSAYVYALAHIRTTNMSLYAYVNPVVAVILGWLILKEQLTWVSITAMCVILAGVALVQTARPRKAAVAVAEAVPAAEKNAA